MPTMDQVVWASVNVSTEGETKPFARGTLLPAPASGDEAAEREYLRLGGAIQTVQVVYTPDELAVMAREQGQRAVAAAVAQPVQPEDEPAPAGPPTLPATAGAPPVVVGDEELRAEHEHAAQRRGAGGKFAKAKTEGD